MKKVLKGLFLAALVVTLAVSLLYNLEYRLTIDKLEKEKAASEEASCALLKVIVNTAESPEDALKKIELALQKGQLGADERRMGF